MFYQKYFNVLGNLSFFSKLKKINALIYFAPARRVAAV